MGFIFIYVIPKGKSFHFVLLQAACKVKRLTFAVKWPNRTDLLSSTVRALIKKLGMTGLVSICNNCDNVWIEYDILAHQYSQSLEET